MTQAIQEMNEPVLTAEELAARWKVHKMTVYKRAWSGTLESFTLGRRRRFPLAAVLAFENGTNGHAAKSEAR